jgi:Domain of unknown function (DUF4388)
MTTTTIYLRQLPKALQSVQSNRMSGSLLVEHQNTYAVLVFNQGKLKHAQIGLPQSELEGEEALYTLLTWEDGQLNWEEYILEAKVTVTEPQERSFYENIRQLINQDGFDKREATSPISQVTLQAINSTSQLAKAQAQNAHPVSPAPAPVTQSPIIDTLTKMGVPYVTGTQKHSLNSHFYNSFISAREIAGKDWEAILTEAKLTKFLTQTPPDDDKYTIPVEYLSRLNYGYEKVYGHFAPNKIKEWGRHATFRSIALRKSSKREQNILRLVPGQQRKISIILSSFTKSMNNVRNEKTHLWKQIDNSQYWLIHYTNLYALGRKRKEKSCHIWTASIEATLEWAGMVNEWFVEELECGCVTGSFNCVFSVKAY